MENHERIAGKGSAAGESGPRRITIKDSLSVLVAILAVVTTLVLGPFRFISIRSNSDILWARVVRTVQNNRGMIYRETIDPARPDHSMEAGYRMVYQTPRYFRTDIYDRNGAYWRTIYIDMKAQTEIELLHHQMTYSRRDLAHGDLGDRTMFMPPEVWVQRLVTCEHRKLEPKMIDHIRCRGIETQDLAWAADTGLQIDKLVARLWASTDAGVPVRLEAEISGSFSGRVVIDQFEWNIEFNPRWFEARIPTGYESK